MPQPSSGPQQPAGTPHSSSLQPRADWAHVTPAGCSSVWWAAHNVAAAQPRTSVTFPVRGPRELILALSLWLGRDHPRHGSSALCRRQMRVLVMVRRPCAVGRCAMRGTSVPGSSRETNAARPRPILSWRRGPQYLRIWLACEKPVPYNSARHRSITSWRRHPPHRQERGTFETGSSGLQQGHWRPRPGHLPAARSWVHHRPSPKGYTTPRREILGPT